MKIYYFLCFALLLSCCKSELPKPQMGLMCDDDHLNNGHSLAEELQDILDDYVDKGLPGITALIHTPGEGTLVRSSGYASLSSGALVTHCNAYFSGSVAKMYTVTAAMTLYEEGLLDLEDPISDYLPVGISSNLPNGNTATIRQLMNHKAGMPDHDDDKDLNDFIESNKGHLPSAEKQLSYLYDEEPRFPAGTDADYSSAHTVVLGLIIDSVSKKHHSHIITERIIQPLGLSETYYKNEQGYPKPDNLVTPYFGTHDKRDEITEEAINYAQGSQGDAGIIATAYDYFLFLKGLIEGDLLSPPVVSSMIGEPWLFDDGKHSFTFGLGLFVVGLEGEPAKIGHSGSTLGGMSHVYYYPNVESYIVVLTNTILENNPGILLDWSGSTLVQTGSNHLMDQLEAMILE